MVKITTQTSASSDDIPIPRTQHRLHKRVLAMTFLFTLLIPSVLTGPQVVFAISDAPTPYADIAYTEAYQAKIPADWDPLLVSILETETRRLMVTDPEWTTRVDSFIEMVKQIESNGQRKAYNKSGAMSYFQFKGPSIETAYNRLINYMQRNELGRTPGWSKTLKNNPTSIYNVSESRQAVFMIINIIEQDRQAGLFSAFLLGDTEAAKEIYYKYHHTRPDKATIVRTQNKYNEFF